MLPTNPIRILVADDDRAILDLYQRVLSPVREKEEAALFADLDALAGSLFGDPGNDPQPAAPAAPAASYELVQCQQGDAAVDMVTRALEEHRPFAVAFLDIQMPPGPDGVWTAERIRALDPQIELVMVSGYADLHPDDIVRRVPPAHKLLYIQKPFHPQEITHFASALGAKWQAEWKLRQAHNDLVTANEGLLEEIDARKRAETALRKAHDELERRVKERTVELVKANEQLKQEIEEHKQTEEALREAKQAAEAGNQAKGEFLANMSHELRTPLNHIIGFTELVVGQHFGDLNETQAEYLNDVLHSSNHLLSLINDILDLSKVEAGKLELEPSEVDLRMLLKNSLSIIKEKAMKHGIQLSTDIEDIPETITADERKLKQILYNLLSNAVKFTPEGGEIHVDACMADCIARPGLRWEDSKNLQIIESQIHGNDVPSTKRKKCAEFSVSDTGIGIRPEDRARIFSPFEQVEGSSSRRFQGTGLGLSLTKSLVELHGGMIWAGSEGEGKGSTFTFIIPI